jgi:hypothetical protein
LRAVIAKVLGNVETYRPWRVCVRRIGVLPIAFSKAILPLCDRYTHRRIRNEDEIDLHYGIGGNYVHQTAFKRHYSRLTSSIVELPLWAKPAAIAYGWLKKWRQSS